VARDQKAVNDIQKLFRLTLDSAQEAVYLYFEPVIQIHHWIMGSEVKSSSSASQHYSFRRIWTWLMLDVDLRAVSRFVLFGLSLYLIEIAQNIVPDPWRQVVNLVCFPASIFFASMLVAHFDSEYSRVAACGTGLLCFVIIFLVYFDVSTFLFRILFFMLSGSGHGVVVNVL
jgi:hypothetical protein